MSRVLEVRQHGGRGSRKFYVRDPKKQKKYLMLEEKSSQYTGVLTKTRWVP